MSKENYIEDNDQVSFEHEKKENSEQHNIDDSNHNEFEKKSQAEPVDDHEQEMGDHGDDIEATDHHFKNESMEDNINPVEKLEQELYAMNDKFLRLTAELENFRKRSIQEIDSAKKYAIKNFAVEVLSVKDSLDLATQVDLTKENSDVIAKMKEGLDLTLKQLNQAFSKFDIEEINPQTGDKLNPESHQAMSIQPTEEVEPNCIVTVFQKGYRLSGRVLRPAMVVVAKKP